MKGKTIPDIPTTKRFNLFEKSSTDEINELYQKDSTPLTKSLAQVASKVLFTSNTQTFPNVNIIVNTVDTNETFKVNALLDSGATGLYVDRKWIENKGIKTTPLEDKLFAYNADGSPNPVTHEVELRFAIQGHISKGWFHVVNLHNKAMIIGMSWLRNHNPVINWETGKIEFPRCPKSCGAINPETPQINLLIQQSINELVEMDDDFINELLSEEIFITENPATRIAREALSNKKVLTLEDIKKGPYADYADVFSEEGFQDLPPHRPWDHAIDLVPDWESRRWKARIYPLSPKEKEIMNEQIDELLTSGRIIPSKSPLASPTFFVAKKDGKLRMVIDYRKLNDITIKNAYPLPLIPELTDKWKGCVRFTKLDVRAGYHNIRIRGGDEWKTAFTIHRGLFEWRVMPFGVCNAPATFQNMMDDVLIVQVRQGGTNPYIDDVIIGTPKDPSGKLDEDSFHQNKVRPVLEQFRKEKLFLKPEKCTFSEKTVEYLGFIISGKSITMEPSKVDAIVSWPEPKTLTQLRSFIGFTNFYRRFIQDYALIARPLNDLMKKDVPFEWTKERQHAFDAIKNAITTAPVLIHPDLKEPFVVEADASLVGYGAILSQEREGKLHPIAFISRSFDKAQRSYPTHDRELHAIVEAFKEWRHYLIQSPNPVTVLTDHHSLQFFRTAHDLSRRQTRYAVELGEFNIHLKHRPGRQSGKPDALSRRPDFGDGKDDNKNEILLPDEMFINQIEEIGIKEIILKPKNDLTQFQPSEWFINALEEPDSLTTLGEQLYKEQSRDPIIEDINKTKESEKDRIRGWKIDEEQLWRYYGKIYVPLSLRQIVFTTLHSDPTAGHPGIKPTIDLIGRNFYWPELKQDVTKWVQRCDKCQRYKNFPGKKPGQLHPNEIPSKPWEIVSMDLLTDLPESEGYDSILVVVDRFSKMIRLIRTNKTMNSHALVRLCWDQVWKDFGLPRVIISDRGPQFASKFVRAHNEAFKIKTALSTAYHPQTDGQSERMIQEVQKVLRMYVNHFQNDWSSKVTTVEFAMNNTIKSSTGYTPFYLVMGQHPNPGNIPQNLSDHVPSAEEFFKELEQAREVARKALGKAADYMKKFADRKRGPTPTFHIGDKVLLDASNYPSIRPSRKLSERRYGPFKIIEKISDLNYRLQIPENWNIHPVFHVDQLRRYHENPEKPNFPEPPPDLVEGKEEYEVEKILDAQYRQLLGTRKKTLHFLVKWKGYHDKDNTWEPLENVQNSKDLLENFYKENPAKPKENPNPQSHPKKLKKKSGEVQVLNSGRSIQIDKKDFRPLENDTYVISWPGAKHE